MFSFLRRKSRQQAAAANPPTQNTPSKFGTVPETGASDGAPQKLKLPDKDNEVRRELDGHSISGELQGEGYHPYELSDGRILRREEENLIAF